MPKLLVGVICGIVFAIADVALMAPMSITNKRRAMLAAFVSRFGIGFVLGACTLPWPGWAAGLLFGLLLSLPDAIITSAVIPILGTGTIGGVIIGIVVARYGH